MKEKQHSRINKNLSKTEARSKTDQESREFEDKKNDILDQLKQMELLEEHDELKVWDVKKIKNLTFPEKKSTFYYDNEKNEGWLAGLKNKTELFYLLSDEQGISREEYETVQNKKNIKPRSLFYLPKNTEEAFNEQEIRNDNSLLRYWDVGERVQNYSDTLTLPSGEKISLQEMYVAYTIYNTFKAYRDKNNNLKIWDAQQNEWKKFTARFFTEHAKSKLNKRKREKGTGNYLGFTGFGKPVEFLIKELPHLAKSNLLQINDFRVLGEKGGQIIRPKHKLARNGTAFIDGAGYMLGGEFANRKKTPKKQGKFNIVKLDSITAGVVEERPGGINEIVKIFKLKSEDEKNERLEKIKERHKRGEIKGDPTSLRGFLNFKKTEIGMQPYSVTEQNKRFSDETPEEYAERIRLLGDFNFINKISQEFATEAGIGLHNLLTWREQQWLAATCAHVRGIKEKIITQTKKHGPDFLRAFLSCEQGLEQGQNIIALAEKLLPEIADKIFAKYREIVDITEKITASLESDKDKLNNETLNKIRQNILMRGKNLLVKFAETAKKERTDGNEILAELDNIRADIILFAETYRESGQPIEELPETTFGGYRGDELTATDKEQMRENAEMNMTDKDFGEKVVLPSLDESFADPKNTFYLLKHGDKVVSSMRLADRGDDYYFGSFYADPNAQGAGFGQEMMTRVVAQKAMEKPVVASAVADQAPIQHYINKQGFVATKIMPDYENTGTDLFEIKLDKTSDEKPETTRQVEKISFDLKKDRARFIQVCEERLNSGEYVLTKYEIDKNGITQCEFQKTAQADAVVLERIRKNIHKAA